MCTNPTFSRIHALHARLFPTKVLATFIRLVFRPGYASGFRILHRPLSRKLFTFGEQPSPSQTKVSPLSLRRSWPSSFCRRRSPFGCVCLPAPEPADMQKDIFKGRINLRAFCAMPASRKFFKKLRMHQPGIEPGSVPWQGTILPLDHWCRMLSVY